MTHHPMLPTNEQIRKWENAYFDHNENLDVLLIEAYQAGADAELEACCEYFGEDYFVQDRLRTARRPKPPSLADDALKKVQKISKNGYPCNYQDDADWHIIIRALEHLKELEKNSK
jgi:hypothetical protein